MTNKKNGKKNGMGGSKPEMGESRNGDRDRFSDAWHRHYDTMYATTGNTFDYYEPAYRYGVSLRNEQRYMGWDWDRLEPAARRTWDERYPRTTWDKIKDAVRHAWESAKEAVT